MILKISNTLIEIKQYFIDFCEKQALHCCDIASVRAIKYGDKSLLRKLAFQQGVFWDNLGWKILIK